MGVENQDLKEVWLIRNRQMRRWIYEVYSAYDEGLFGRVGDDGFYAAVDSVIRLLEQEAHTTGLDNPAERIIHLRDYHRRMPLDHFGV